MLHIHFGSVEEEIYNPPVYFDNQYEDEWIVDELSRRMVQDVDRSTVVGAHLIDSPFLGPIAPERLSGGVKTLILMAFDDSGNIFNASACGDNCAKWILEIAKNKDLTITLHNIMGFKDLPFHAVIDNTGEELTDYFAYIKTAILELKKIGE